LSDVLRVAIESNLNLAKLRLDARRYGETWR